MLVLLFRNRPELAPDLLRESLHVELPAYSEVRLESAELTDVVPTEYRADLVVLLVQGRPVLGIVVEVQLSPDPRKRYSWPVYLASLRARLECDCCVLVVTASEATARWARRAIALGPGASLQPLVVGPRGVPVVNDVEAARRDPELAVLSAMAHGHGDVQTAVSIAVAAAGAARGLEEETQMLYCDLIESALGEAARKALSMIPQNYVFQGPSYKRGREEGHRQGREEGAVAMASSVVDVLEARGLEPTDEERDRILASRDVNELRGWLRRAATAERVDQIFDR